MSSNSSLPLNSLLWTDIAKTHIHVVYVWLIIAESTCGAKTCHSGLIIQSQCCLLLWRWHQSSKISEVLQVCQMCNAFALACHFLLPVAHLVLCWELLTWKGKNRKLKAVYLLEQDTVSGNGISWAYANDQQSVCCSQTVLLECLALSRPRQITTPASHHSVFTGWITFLPPNQQCQSTEAIHNILLLGLCVVHMIADNCLLQ